MPQFDPHQKFPDFYENPVIADIGKHQLWTVSDSDKRPIDIQNTLQKINAKPGTTCSRCGTIDCPIVHGAQPANAHQQLMTLPQLTEHLPTAANATVHLDAIMMNVMVLDIEAHCPPAVADQLLRLVTGNKAHPEPQAIYSELSSSGRGYHIVLPVPQIVATLPDVFGRTKIQHPDRWYEILIHHWITFSRNPIPQDRLEQAKLDDSGEAIDWDGVFAQLHTQVPYRPSLGSSIDPSLATQAIEAELTEEEQAVLADVVASHRIGWTKDLHADYAGDTSKWEYGQAIRLVGSVIDIHSRKAMTANLLNGLFSQPEEIKTDRLVALTYLSLVEVLPHRNKHDQLRSGLPYLLKEASSAVADSSTRTIGAG